MMAYRQMLMVQNGVVRRVLVPVRPGNQTNVASKSKNAETSTPLVTSTKPKGNAPKSPVNATPLAVPLKLNQLNNATANNFVASPNATVASGSTKNRGGGLVGGGAPCPICCMLFPLNANSDMIRTHVRGCQDREIALTKYRSTMTKTTKKRKAAPTPPSDVTTSGFDLLLGAATKASKLTSSSSPHEEKKYPTTSVYRGVCGNRGKWQVQINANGKRHYLGYYCSEINAAKAYDTAALHFHGMKAKLNFDIETARNHPKPELLQQIIAAQNLQAHPASHHSSSSSQSTSPGTDASSVQSAASEFEMDIAAAEMLKAVQSAKKVMAMNGTCKDIQRDTNSSAKEVVITI
jgi:hypothetical protein